MLTDNFEQHSESCVLNAQNTWKSALKQKNSLHTPKNELMKIFHGFRVFKHSTFHSKKGKPGNVGNQQKAF